MTPHPDAVRLALGVFEFYGGSDGPDPERAMQCAITSAQGWQERYEAEERRHARHHAISIMESAAILARTEARQRARVHLCITTRHS